MDDWEVSRDLIVKGEQIGSGSFGVCHKGIYNDPEKVNILIALSKHDVNQFVKRSQ